MTLPRLLCKDEDLKDFKKAVEQQTIPAKIDKTGTGTFLCNEAYYISLGVPEIAGKAIFVHLQPYDKDSSDPQNAKVLADMKKAVNATLKKMAEKLKEDP